MCEKKYYEWNLVKNDSCWQNVNVWHDLFKAISMHIADKNLQHCLKVNVASSLGIFRICSVLLRFCVTSWCNRGLTVFWSCDTIGKPNEITRKTILVITLQIWHKLNYGLEVVNYFLATLQWHWIITTIFFHNQILLQYKETWVMIVRCLRAKTRWSIKRVYEILICFFLSKAETQVPSPLSYHLHIKWCATVTESRGASTSQTQQPQVLCVNKNVGSALLPDVCDPVLYKGPCVKV